jgi:hypothetical protein
MSELSERARSKAKSKAERLTSSNSGSVDASGWKEPTDEKGEVQTGMRVLSRRQFKRGGKVAGEAVAARADRKPRKSAHRAFGGAASTGDNSSSSMNPSKPSQRLSESAMKMTSRNGADPYNSQPAQASNYSKLWKLGGGRTPRKSGGSLTAESLINRNVKSANEDRDGSKHIGGMKKGGRAHKMVGGPMMGRSGMPAAQPMPGARPMMRKAGGKASHGETCSCAKCSGGRVGKAAGGGIPDGTRPAGGRLARQGGGRAKKGMNVNIIIAPPGGNKPAMPAGAMPPPGAGPVGLHQAAPPPQMPPPGAGAPMGPPPGAMPPPQMRKRGGRAYPIESGAGGGLGRLEKARAYGG